jgi:hypothetical protein
MGKLDDRAIELYTDGLFSLDHIGKFFGVTRQGVKKYLNVRGIDTSKKGGLEITCDNCGVKFKKPRCQIRNNIKNYCKPECYYAELGKSGYIENRHKSRQAREIVREVYPIDSKNVVHHVNGDQADNRLENLMVFKNNSDHMRWHRAGQEKSGVVPEWRGDGIEPTIREKKIKSSKGKDLSSKISKSDEEMLRKKMSVIAKKNPESVSKFFNPQPKGKKKS